MNELALIKHYEGYGLELYKAKEKILLNRNNEALYIDLHSLANALNLTYGKLLELINYNASSKGNLAFYRNKDYRTIKIFHVQGIKDLFKVLVVYEIDRELLNTLRIQVNKLIELVKQDKEVQI